MDGNKNENNVGFTQIGDGELLELVNEELRSAYADIRNPNKVAGSPREVVVKIKLAAPEKRKSAKVTYSVASKLGVREGGECHIYLAGQGESVESALAPMNQPQLFEQREN